MRGAIGRDDAVAIVDPNSVIAQRLSEQISQTPARFLQNDLRPAGVPLFCARRKMQIKIGLLLSNQSDLNADGSAPYFILELKRADHSFHARTAMRSAGSEHHFIRIGATRDGHSPGRFSFFFDPWTT